MQLDPTAVVAAVTLAVVVAAVTLAVGFFLGRKSVAKLAAAPKGYEAVPTPLHECAGESPAGGSDARHDPFSGAMASRLHERLNARFYEVMMRSAAYELGLLGYRLVPRSETVVVETPTFGVLQAVGREVYRARSFYLFPRMSKDEIVRSVETAETDGYTVKQIEDLLEAWEAEGFVLTLGTGGTTASYVEESHASAA